jgi:hypothetical protein
MVQVSVPKPNRVTVAVCSATMSDEATCNTVDMYVLSAACEEKKVLR